MARETQSNVTIAEARAAADARDEADKKAEVGNHAGPEINDAPEEQVVTYAMSAPSATSPIKGEELFGAFDQNLEKAPEFEPARLPERLPREVVESKDLRHFNANARENLVSAVLRPGHKFSAPGRYHDVTNVENKFDVLPGDILPDGKFVISERYLLPSYDRGVV